MHDPEAAEATLTIRPRWAIGLGGPPIFPAPPALPISPG
jgi:hypothetical protein